MFTAAVFKELLLPLFNDVNERFIYLPLKATTESDFFDDIKYIISNCGLDPEPFNVEINNLNSMRKHFNSGASSQTEMFHYYIELEQIYERFSIKNMSFTHFNWTNSFNSNVCESQKSLAFEKSNILFNIASKINNDTLQSLHVDNVKISVRDLCVSATVFDWISNNFANAPLPDIQPNFSKFLSNICLLQAQELAFFITLQEEKGLKILARLSLALMNLIQSAKEFSSNNSQIIPTWLNQKIDDKATLHTFIHCLIMAEFWDGQELYDIAFDLYSKSNIIFENTSIRDKTAIADYLKISLIRSEKERHQISYEGKKASDSTVRLDPYFLANTLDFKQLLNPFISSYSPLFKNVYPLRVIESQSEFDAKANTILKTLERASEEVSVIFEELSAKLLSNSEDFVIELRSKIMGGEIGLLKATLIEIDTETDNILSLKERIELKGLQNTENRHINDIWGNLKSLLDDIDHSKARIILNDNAFIQTTLPFLKQMYLTHLENIKTTLTDYEGSAKTQFKLYENLKDEVNTHPSI